MIEQILRETAARVTTPATYPSAYHSTDGDCVFFYNEGGEHVRQRVDGLLTLFRAPDDRRIIGLQIKGVKNLPPHEAMEVQVEGVEARTGKRIDTVRLLLYSFGQPDDDQQQDPAQRTEAYAEAFNALGARQVEIELVEV